MATLAAFLEGVRYDLTDYETGLEFDDRELINYLNRMIVLVDSTFNAVNSDLLFGVEEDINTVDSQNYIDITNMNNGHWDSIQNVWIGTNQLTPISLSKMYNKRMWYSSDAHPQYWALDTNHILFETTADSAYATVEIHYKARTRPLLENYSDTFTADAANNDIQPTSGHTFITTDGPFQFSTTAADLPNGLSTSTDYWAVFDPANPNDFMVATTKNNAYNGTTVTLSDAGTGTHTITLTEYMPYDSKYDNLFREMLVLHGKAKKEGQISNTDSIFQEVFRKRMMEEHIRRTFVPPIYYIDF